jgi:hypothetical protein
LRASGPAAIISGVSVGPAARDHPHGAPAPADGCAPVCSAVMANDLSTIADTWQRAWIALEDSRSALAGEPSPEGRRDARTSAASVRDAIDHLETAYNAQVELAALRALLRLLPASADPRAAADADLVAVVEVLADRIGARHLEYRERLSGLG